MKNLILIIVLIFITGCSKQLPTHEDVANQTVKKEQFNEPKVWKQVEDSGAVNTDWVKTFNDPILEELIKEGLANNREIRSLKIQIAKSQSLVKKAAAALKPTVGLSGKYSSRNSDALNEIHGGGLTIGWEADIWGRLELAKTASLEGAMATQSDYEFARQSLVASIAKAWVMLTTSKLQADYSNEIVKLFEKELQIMNVKHEVGQVDKKSVYLAKSNLSSAKNAYSMALTSMEDSQRNLELLLGRYPSALIKGNNSLSKLTYSIPLGIPSEVLERRPDLVAAEQRVAAAFYKQRESELLHLPKFSFSIGASINNLTNAASDLLAGIFFPLYQGGAIEAEVDKATAIQKQSIEDYAQKVLVAFKEVETSLSLEEKLLEQENYLKEIVSDNKNSLQLSKVAFEVGSVEYLEVSQLTNRLIASEISLIDISSKRIFNRINLHLALGGGFEDKK